jgi:hypothetical protein
MNYWVVLLLIYLVLGLILYLNYDQALSILLTQLLSMTRLLFKLEHGATTQENNATTRVVCDTLS